MTEPLVPLLAPTPTRSLREWAAVEVPKLARDGVRFTARVIEDDGTELVAMLQWRDVTGAVVFRTANGQRSAEGVIEWRF